jgi:hypothetical protein
LEGDDNSRRMFSPSQHDVRRFFCEAWRKDRERIALEPMEVLAAQWIEQHPEHHADLADVNEALAATYSVESGRTNPFLHLSMHLTISEQCSIDQPRGIRQAVEMVWASQRSRLPPDGQAYLEAVRKRATR